MWDLTLPGYKYLGPFNSLDKGVPENLNDLTAWLHDLGYTAYQQKSGSKWSVYFVWNEADVIAYEKWQRGDYGGKIAKLAFGIKKMMNNQGLVPMRTQQLQDAPIWNERKRQIEEYQSLLNSPSHAKMGNKRLRYTDEDEEMKETPMLLAADGGGSGKKTKLNETPVDKTSMVTRGPKDYAHASLPYILEGRFNERLSAYDMAFRMTSPYDCLVKHGTMVDWNTEGSTTGTHNTVPGVADANDNVVSQASWYTWYSSIYKYYHVKSCRWHATIINLKTEGLWVHQMYYNEDLPPVLATNQDMRQWNDCKSYFVPSAVSVVNKDGNVITENLATERQIDESNRSNPDVYAGPDNGTENPKQVVTNKDRRNILQLSGSYTPGQAKHEVKLDDAVENWTATTTNPTLPERLLFRFKPDTCGVTLNEAATSDRSVNVRFSVDLEYLVEFKELLPTLKWPLTKQPATISVATTEDQIKTQAVIHDTVEIKY